MRLVLDMAYQYGALFVEFLQKTKIPPQIFLLVSHFADPPAVNLIAFPVAFFLHPVLGSATLLSINFSEWLNCVLKWILDDDDRPYWWVHTSEKAYIKLKQFPLTCEIGPGSPSGHCMVMVSGWLPLLLYIRGKYNKLGSVLLILFITCTVLVAVSRIYIATHFPHQTILGTIAGALIGLFFYEWSLSFYKRSSKSGKKIVNFHSSILNSPSMLVNTGVLSLIAGKAVSILLNYLGTDVERSYRLAAKYCARPEWLHPSTSVMASYARVTGALIGLAGALFLRPLTSCTSKPVVTPLWEIVLPSIITFLAHYVFHQVILFISPHMKSLIEPIPFIPDISFLFYMAILGALSPMIVVFAFSTLHDKFFLSFKKQSTSKPKKGMSTLANN